MVWGWVLAESPRIEIRGLGGWVWCVRIDACGLKGETGSTGAGSRGEEERGAITRGLPLLPLLQDLHAQ